MPRILVLSFLAALATVALLAPATASAEVGGFEPAASFRVDAEAIEIVDALPDGRTLVSTQGSNVAFTDITDPRHPRDEGALPIGGSVTTVAVSPDGSYALAGVQTSSESGDLVVKIDIEERRLDGEVGVAEGIDSVAFSPDGAYATVAIEEENDTATAGLVQIIDLVGDSPAAWPVRDVPVPLDPVLIDPADAQPEYVDVNSANKAVVSLQEQNGVMIVDLPSGDIEHLWSAGEVNRLADLDEDDEISFTEPYEAVRNPDAIAWTPGEDFLVEADEGELNNTGGRGFTIRKPDGTVVFDSGAELEKIAAARGMYPENRSENRGTEFHGAGSASYDGTDYAFVASEQGAFLAVYEIEDPEDPRFVQLLPTGGEPESVLTIPQRDLVITSDETTGTISVFRGIPELRRDPSAPDLVSAGDPWLGFSGLDSAGDGKLVAVTDNKLLPAAIWTLDPRAPLGDPTVAARLPVTGLTGDPDPQDIAIDPKGGYWIANESGSQARLAHVTPAGVTDVSVPLPAAGSLPAGFGNTLSGIDVNEDGSKVYFSTEQGGIGELTPGPNTFRAFKVDVTRSKISDLAVTPGGDLTIVDTFGNHIFKPGNPSVFRISLPETGTQVTDKQEVLRVPIDGAYEQNNGLVEGLAVTAAGDVWTVRNNGGHSESELREHGRLLTDAVEEPSLGLPGAAGGGPTTDGKVLAIRREGSRVLIGGTFSMIGNQTGGAGVVDPATGSLLSTVPITGGVSQAISDGGGGVYVGGSFTGAGGTSRARLARIKADGTVDPTFAPTIDNGTVSGMILSGGRLYILGSFTTIGGSSRARLAAVDPTTGDLDASFDAQLVGTPQDFAIQGSTLYVVGSGITSAQGQPRSRAAAFDLSVPAPTVTPWTVNANNAINQVLATPSRLIVGGTFTSISGEPRSRLAAVSLTDGSLEPGWTADLDASVGDMVLDGNRVIAAGGFTELDGVPTDGGVIAFDQDSTLLDPAFQPGWSAGSNEAASRLLVAGDTLYVGGGFTSFEGRPHARIAALDRVTGATHREFTGGADFGPSTMVMGAGGLFLAGGFTALGESRANAAAFDLATEEVDEWAPAVRGTVSAIELGGSRVYLGGQFSEIEGQSRGNLVAVDGETGQHLTAFDPQIVGGQVLVILRFDGRLYAGGGFLGAAGTSHSRLVALDPISGEPDPGFDGEAFGGAVLALEAVGDELIAGGGFATIAGSGPAKLAALDPDTGQPRSGFDSGIEGGAVSALEFDPGADDLYVGGSFREVSGEFRPLLIRVDPASGSLEPEFAPVLPASPGNLNLTVNALGLTEGEVIAAGEFFTAGNQGRKIAAFDKEDGAIDPWAPNIAAQNGLFFVVNAVAVSGSTVIAGGDFNLVDGVFHPGLAIFRGVAPVNLTPPGVAGDLVEGSELICSPGTWQNSPVSFEFEWRRDGVSIPGAEGETYTTVPEDVGKAITCAVAAQNQTGVGAAVESAALTPTPGVPALLGAPTISGEPKAGAKLTAGSGSWRNEPGSFAYQWLADGEAIAAANAATYEVTEDDAGRWISVRVTATNAQGESEAATSAPLRIAALQGVPGEPGEPGAPGEPGEPGGDGEDGKDGAPGANGKDGAPGSQGPGGPQGPAGSQGPRGAAGRDAKVSCRLRGGKVRPRVVCEVKLTGAGSSRARAKLLRGGRVYARGPVGAMKTTGVIPSGRYTLVVTAGERKRRFVVTLVS